MEGNRKSVSIHCAKTGIHVDGANNIGSTSDDIVSSRRQFLRVAVHWWNTYCGRDEEDESPKNCEVGTIEEQTRRYEDYCRAHTKVEGCIGCPLDGYRRCQIAWMRLPYMEKEGVAK